MSWCEGLQNYNIHNRHCGNRPLPKNSSSVMKGYISNRISYPDIGESKTIMNWVRSPGSLFRSNKVFYHHDTGMQATYAQIDHQGPAMNGQTLAPPRILSASLTQPKKHVSICVLWREQKSLCELLVCRIGI